MTGARQERPALFDEEALGPRRDRAMRLGFAGGADFLWHAAAEMLGERVGDVARAFPHVALAGTGGGAIHAGLPPGLLAAGGRGLVQTDPSPAMAAAAARALPEAETLPWQGEALPFEPGAADLAVSAGLLHWLNDPVGHLVQLRHALKPDGLMIAVLAGGQTLAELRAALAEAEAEVTGGLSPRVAPMGEIRDLGGLLQRAGLQMPVADSEKLTVSYPSPLHLMRELRAMGETSILAGRLRGATRRAVLLRAAAIYAEGFPDPADPARVRATFELVFLTGWSPGPDQPRPLRPGSAKARIADALRVPETRLPRDE